MFCLRHYTSLWLFLWAFPDMGVEQQRHLNMSQSSVDSERTTSA